MSEVAATTKKYNTWIIILSITIPIAVALLFSVRLPGVERLGFLPPIYATINGITAVLLVTAVFMIKNGNRKWHEIFMKSAIVLSVVFLMLYVAYHATADATKFGDEDMNGVVSTAEQAAVGKLAYIYYFILVSHIILSIGVIPVVLITYVRAITGRFKMHKKIARFTFPIWLYVAVTGVVVYLMISPYYPS